MQFKTLTEDEFRCFSKTHKYKNFFQTVETGLLREKSGFKKHFVGIVDNNVVIAATLLVSRNKEFYAPRGFLIDFNNFELLKFFTLKVKNYVKNNNGLYLKIDPYVIYKERNIEGNIVENGINNQEIVNNLKRLGYIHYGYTRYHYITKQVRWIFVLDIEDKTLDEILKNMKQGTRTRVNKTIKYKYKIRELKKDELNIFVEILKQTGDRRGFDSQSLKYFEDLYNIYGKSMVKFLLVYVDLNEYIDLLKKEIENEESKSLKKQLNNNKNKDNINKEILELRKKLNEALEYKKKYNNIINLSSAMFVTYGNEIVYLSSGNKKEFMSLNGQYGLQWEMIKYGIKNKFKRYNFYGISGNFNPKDSQYGIYNFKKGFDGKVIELIGEFDLPINKLYYLHYLLVLIKRVIFK